ncbi:MAG: DUF447 domain-containing protein [Candidatus Helarchaeota archaeon]
MVWEKSSILSIDMFLEKFNLQRNAIYETLVSTYNETINFPHAAPMGIIFEGNYILIQPYKTSRTYKFIQKNNYAIINFIDDLEIFYIFSQNDKDMKKLKNYFKIISEFTTPVFKNSNLSIEVKVVRNLENDNIRAKFLCEPLNYIYRIKDQTKFEPINRAAGCLLESIIHFTRIEIYRKINTPQLISKIDNLISLLKQYRRIIKKVYPQTKYSEIIDDIFKRLNID